MAGSIAPPLTSLTIAAPGSNRHRATRACQVSTDRTNLRPFPVQQLDRTHHPAQLFLFPHRLRTRPRTLTADIQPVSPIRQQG